MKFILSTITIFFFAFSFAQTAQEHYKNGVQKHNKEDYKGAIKDYNNAIKEDKSFMKAYFNRGTCYLALNNFKDSYADFTKAIELNPKDAESYYRRATIFVVQDKYLEALPDLDKTIELDPAAPDALTLRGQIRMQSGNEKGGCEDFNLAKKNGDKQADEYIKKFCGNKKQKNESLMLDWPDAENWKVGSQQENDKMTLVELIHANETLENWTEIGTMTSIKGAKNVGLDKAMNLMYDQSKINSPKAKLTFIEKDENAEFPWIIFTIECPNFKNDKTPESQLWYIVQGETALYTNFRAVKKAEISPDLKTRWIAFFKTAKVVNQ
jgi:tetratricopeptide (TPR) repeat protein